MNNKLEWNITVQIDIFNTNLIQQSTYLIFDMFESSIERKYALGEFKIENIENYSTGQFLSGKCLIYKNSVLGKLINQFDNNHQYNSKVYNPRVSTLIPILIGNDILGFKFSFLDNEKYLKLKLKFLSCYE